MNEIRLGLAGVGLAVAAYGARLLLADGLDDLASTLKWLVGGVIVHDGILAPATIGVVFVASRFLPAWARGPATGGLVVLGTVTIAAVPVLGRFGARADNPTLLDRNYVGGWLVFVGLVAVGVAVAAVVRRYRVAVSVPDGSASR
jgi:hypothetical protein